MLLAWVNARADAHCAERLGWHEGDAAVDQRLRRLMARGFQFIHPTDPAGAIQAVVGVRVHHGVVDVVQLGAEHEVTAVRIPADEVDILKPQVVLWQSSGRVVEVLDALLGLPDHDVSGDQGHVEPAGQWVQVSPGESKWVS